MTCSRCQRINPPRSNYCLGCGARLGLVCAACGAGLPTDAQFCNACGTPAAAASAGVGSERLHLASPQQYTPGHLADRILTSRAAIEGKRKQVTVMFADLKGSMELLTDRDPEEARKLLDPILELMMEAVHRYEGTVNQVLGDGIMALFGAPLAHEDHALRACYACPHGPPPAIGAMPRDRAGRVPRDGHALLDEQGRRRAEGADPDVRHPA